MGDANFFKNLNGANSDTEEYRDKGVCRFTFGSEHYYLFCKLKKLLDEKDFSIDALEISTKVIDLNPQHYTAWYFRRRIIKECVINVLEYENKFEFLREELSFLRVLSERAPKCYQIWWHMRIVREWIGFEVEELEFLNERIKNDSKNMYMWNHRTWFINNYLVFDDQILIKELDYISSVIFEDCRNNSAWCYRHFIFKNLKKLGKLKQVDFIEETEYIVNWLLFAPHNDSIWNYIISFYSKIMVSDNSNGKSLHGTLSIKNSPQIFRDVLDEIYENFNETCHQAVYLKACLAFEESDMNFVIEAFNLLQVVDPIRRHYWKWRADNLR
ncbi:protein farnesyltransferase/geranylgeranyltransferase type-1 subunit alpha-like [Cryptosporidium felis]|nr:protein farnesyltransferase/geranylgeranyltransferase type-1 subunit alpha-like [Cryptosporidium felis]